MLVGISQTEKGKRVLVEAGDRKQFSSIILSARVRQSFRPARCCRWFLPE